MTLPIKKYIDTKYQTYDSISSSNFKINLLQSLTFPDNTVFYIDEISIPNAWYVIEENINDKIHINIISKMRGLYMVFNMLPHPDFLI